MKHLRNGHKGRGAEVGFNKDEETQIKEKALPGSLRMMYYGLRYIMNTVIQTKRILV